MGTGFLSGDDDDVPEVHSGDGLYNIGDTLKTTELYTLKWLKWWTSCWFEKEWIAEGGVDAGGPVTWLLPSDRRAVMGAWIKLTAAEVGGVFGFCPVLRGEDSFSVEGSQKDYWGKSRWLGP